MASEIEIERWNLYQKKYEELFRYGVNNGLIRPFDEDFISKARNYYYGGMPLSILLLCNDACNGFCYDRALFVAVVLDDENYRMVDADVDSIRLNPRYIIDKEDNEHYANYCFIERTMSDGSVWVYDTSASLVFDRDLYYKMQNPVITKINEKESLRHHPDYFYLKGNHLDREKYGLPLLMPIYESIAEIGVIYYTGLLRREISLFKKMIGYDDIAREIEEDMIAKGFLKGVK